MPRADVPTLADKAERKAGRKLPLAERALIVAEATPRPVIHALLKRMLPKVAVATRKPSATEALLASGAAAKAAMGIPERQPRGFGGTGRRKRIRNRTYQWIGYDTSRYDSFRNYMLSTIIKPHTSTTAALQAHAESGQYADQVINFSWAEKEGYIRFTN